MFERVFFMSIELYHLKLSLLNFKCKHARVYSAIKNPNIEHRNETIGVSYAPSGDAVSDLSD